MKKYYILFAALLTAGLILTGCGGSAPAAEQETEAPAETVTTEAATEEERVELTDDDYFDVVFADAPLQSQDAQNVNISRKDNGTCVFTFSTVDGNYSYTIDSYTGEILEKVMPDKITTSSSKTVTLDDDALFDELEKICPVDFNTGKNLKIKRNKDKSIFEVSFSTDDGDFYYSFDSNTGELLDKKEPENITEKGKGQDDDPYGTAISACCDYAGVSISEAQNIQIKEGEGRYDVAFTADGKNYSFSYDTATGKVEEN